MSESSPEIIVLHEIVEANGKTIKENNLAKQHAIPIGTLVEAKWDEWLGEGACMKVHARLWVVRHDRDCDGTPLYSLSRWKDDPAFAQQVGQLHAGFPEDMLTPVEVTPELREGYGALGWGEDE